MMFITGPTGSVGRALVSELEARDAVFRVGHRSVSSAGERAVHFDWERPETHAPALAGCDTLFLLTPVTPAMVVYTSSLCAVAKTQGVKRIVKLSVTGAGPSGMTLQGLHAEAEAIVQQSAARCVMLRSNGFMQNFPKFYGANPAQGGNLFLPHGTGQASWIDVADVAAVAAAVLSTPEHNGVYELTGPEALSTARVAEILSTCWGHSYAHVDVPEAAARDAARQRGVPEWNAKIAFELHALIREGKVARVTNDVERILERRARSFDDFAVDFAAVARGTVP